MIWLRRWFTALTFYTRLPGLRFSDPTPEGLSGATPFLPMIGWIVGAVAAAVFAGGLIWWPAPVAAVLSVIATVWLTGAFHEDGLADVCDGFGGGWSPEQILEIMKDSCTGAYGVAGLGLALLLKVSLVAALPPTLAPAVLVAGHAVSRLPPVYAIAALPYVRADAMSKARPVARGVSVGGLALATVLGLAPVALLPPPVWWALAPVTVAALGFGRLCRRRLGGYTGDTLGALQQICELAFYLGAAALCASI